MGICSLTIHLYCPEVSVFFVFLPVYLLFSIFYGAIPCVGVLVSLFMPFVLWEGGSG